MLAPLKPTLNVFLSVFKTQKVKNIKNKFGRCWLNSCYGYCVLHLITINQDGNIETVQSKFICRKYKWWLAKELLQILMMISGSLITSFALLKSKTNSLYVKPASLQSRLFRQISWLLWGLQDCWNGFIYFET
jgi:hypothetical protein